MRVLFIILLLSNLLSAIMVSHGKHLLDDEEYIISEFYQDSETDRCYVVLTLKDGSIEIKELGV